MVRDLQANPHVRERRAVLYGKDLTVSGRLVPRGRRGFSCYVAYSATLEEQLSRRYGREGLCLKIFHRKRGPRQPVDVAKIVWGPELHCLLVDCTKVQNLYARHGIAPRVYDLVVVNGKVAQVTDYLGGQSGIDRVRKKKAIELAREYGLAEFASKTFGHEPNWVGGKFVDFGSCCLQGDDYLSDLRKRVVHSNGRRKVYQPVPELGVTDGRRNLEYRYRRMHLDELTFDGKDVLDLGCSVGSVCREAARRGARRVVGIDDVQADLAYEISNWLGYWNLDFLNLTLPTTRKVLSSSVGIEKFDVIFALAILKWAGGYRPWVVSMCKKGGTVYLESHDLNAGEFKMARLRRDFRKVERLGDVTDFGKRVLLRCVK